MHLFTAIQVSCLAALWIVKSSPVSLALPFILILTIPLRMFMTGRLFTELEMKCVSDFSFVNIQTWAPGKTKVAEPEIGCGMWLCMDIKCSFLCVCCVLVGCWWCQDNIRGGAGAGCIFWISDAIVNGIWRAAQWQHCYLTARRSQVLTPRLSQVLSVWSLHVLSVFAWVPGKRSGFLPPSKTSMLGLIHLLEPLTKKTGGGCCTVAAH